MITVTDQYPLKHPDFNGTFWIELRAEITPSVHRFWKAWWIEIKVERAEAYNPPLKPNEFNMPYHFYTYDYSTFTLNGAMSKAWKVFDKVTDSLMSEMTDWPWPEQWEQAPAPVITTSIHES